jgi:hypothetical protein
MAAGSQTITFGTAARTSKAAAAFIFAPYGVTLANNNLLSGSIIQTNNGLLYSNAQVMNVIGTNPLNAVAPTGNYQFSTWTESSATNLIITSLTSANTFITVEGSGTVTANWNGIANFIETGLPVGTTWNVIFGGSTQSNEIAVNTLVGPFITPGPTATFTIANQVVGSTTYLPNYASGTSATANVFSVTFTAETCSISPSNSAIGFGSLNPGGSVATGNLVVDSDTGTGPANILVAGANWIGTGTANFFAGNTLWNPISVAAGVGNALLLWPTVKDTGIKIMNGGSGNMFFGTAVPNAQKSGAYTQNIVLENLC